MINWINKLLTKKDSCNHDFRQWEGNEDYRVVILKTGTCNKCGAVRMLTHYGWRIYKDGEIIGHYL